MRNQGLDILRFVAVILVLGRHLNLPSDSPTALVIWQRGGWIGVDLFFVLSGFLVSSLLFKEIKRSGSVNVKRFLIRRAFKLYPAFWFFLAFSVALKVLTHNPPAIRFLLGELFFLQNYLGGVWNHTWSLAVEEHFYLGIAMLVSYITASEFPTDQKSLRAIPVVFFFVSFVCFALRIITLFTFPEYSHEAYLFGTHLRIDSLFFGVLLSYLFHFNALEDKLLCVPTYILYLLGCLLLSPAFIFQLETHRWIPVAGVVLFYIGGGTILLGALRMRQSSSSLCKLLAALGAASYSIYLWHMPVNSWGASMIRKLTGFDDFIVYATTYLLGSLAFGWLMNRIIEAPVLFVRDVLFPSNTSPLQPSEQPPEPEVESDEGGRLSTLMR